jgi:lipoprotein Spr
MIFSKSYIFLILVLGAALVSGCASSSNTSRYKNKSEKKPPADRSVRFTSEERKNNFPKNDAAADTAEYDLLNPDDETLPDDEPPVDISVLRSDRGNAPEGTIKEKMLMEIIRYLNTPYKYGGNSKQGIDCSAFTQTIYNSVFSFQLLRSARQQFTQGLPVNHRENLQFGDLVFFNTRRRIKPGHVGIYLGENLFAHASSSKGVIVSSLDHEYYLRTFMGGRRIESLSTSR